MDLAGKEDIRSGLRGNYPPSKYFANALISKQIMKINLGEASKFYASQTQAFGRNAGVLQ